MSNQPIVLMFHGIVTSDTVVPVKRETGADLYDLSLDKFRVFMKHLKDHGHGNIIITFDDGEMNNFTHAYPVLKEYGMKAYFFAIAKRVGEQGYMGYRELKTLVDNGMTVGSHGLTHEVLTNLNPTQVEEELSASKRTLERNLAVTVTALSIPRGFCNDFVIETAYRVGYKDVFISERPKGLTQPCFTRVAVRGGWSLERFQKALAGCVPFGERVVDPVKACMKVILRERGYNALRSFLIKFKE